MPTYDRKCNSCHNEFEIRCKISEKDGNHTCPNCGSHEGEWLLSAPSLVESQRLMTTKKDSGFKEVLQKIASRNPRTSVNQQV